MEGFVFSVIVGLLASTVMAAHSELPLETCRDRNTYKVIPKGDCTGYYMCVWGRAVEMPDCPPQSSFSPTAHVCVPKGSIYDDCEISTGGGAPVVDPVPKEPPTIEEQCRNGATIIPHPTECHLYYNCSQKYDTVPRHFEQYMKECTYPNLFSVDTLQCEHFEKVQCGQRIERVNGCDYRSHMCGSAHCIPCSVRMPSCEGKSDGINVHEGRLWSPYYVMCYKDRLVSQDKCQVDVDRRPQLFHPEIGECVSLDEIPREHGGTMPDCVGKANGFYLDDFGRCDQYTACEDGKVLNIVKCQHGETFDALLEACITESEACGPCGKKGTC